MKPFQFSKAASLDAALASKTNQQQFLGGGTNLVDLMKKHIAQPDGVIDINAMLPAKITNGAKGISISATVKNSAVANDETVLKQFPLLSKAILAGASPQIRNMASTGGNLLQRTRCPYFYDITTPCNKRQPGTGCSAFAGNNRMNAIVGYSKDCVAVHPSDMCVALAALDAVVVTRNKKKETKSIPFGDFHRLPGSTPQLDNNLPSDAVIVSIDIPSNAFAAHSAYVKLRDRDSYAFALVSVAAALQLNGNTIVAARLASGGVAHKPWRWREAETWLKGKTANADNFAKAAAIAIAGLKPLSHNGFKVPMLAGAIETALQQCIQTT